MALVIGHSQTKFLSEYLCPGSYSVFAYPGAKALDFLVNDTIYEVAQYFSDTLFAPTFDDKNKEWIVNDHFKKQEAPSCQLHYNGNSHWVASFQKASNGPVFILDSLKSSRTLNANLSIQVSQIYNCDTNSITVLVPEVQRQSNFSNCGLFAIAFLTELVHTDFGVDISNVRFIGNSMREHLLNCIENNKIESFPKVSKMPKMPCNDPKVLKIKLYCTCKMPDIINDMVQCGNKSCGKWYHKNCVSSLSDNWLCQLCTW